MTRSLDPRFLCCFAVALLALGPVSTARAEQGTAANSSTPPPPETAAAASGTEPGAQARSATVRPAGTAPATTQARTAAAPRLGSPLRPDGGTQWSVFSGIGINQEINRSATGIHLLSGGVRWSHLWGENFGGFLRGHPAFALEVLPLMAFVEEGSTTWGAGANILYEHHFAVRGRVLPIWQLGAGFLYTERAVPARETRHNFSLLTALGVDVMVTERAAMYFGYRFHHVSNANTGRVNPGINVHAAVFGLSFYR